MLSTLIISDEILQALSRTFLHSLWQGIPAALLAGLVLGVTTRSKASVRYNLLGLVLVLFLLTNGITLFFELQPAVKTTAAAPVPSIYQYVTSPAASLPVQFMDYINTHAAIIMMLWALIFILKFFRLGAGFYQLYQIRHSKSLPVTEEWTSRLRQLAHSLRVTKHIQLLESGRVYTPFTAGFLKPCIFIPAGLLAQLPADQLEAILLHELAHIRRRDYLINILQQFAETIFFFNPALLWISACIKEEREACCDDIVMEHTPHQSSYLEALVAFQGSNLQQPELALTFGRSRHPLLDRVKRILTNENKKLNTMEKSILFLGLAAITAYGFIPDKEPRLIQSNPPTYYIDKPVLSVSGFTDTIKPKKVAQVKSNPSRVKDTAGKVSHYVIVNHRPILKDSTFHHQYYDSVKSFRVVSNSNFQVYKMKGNVKYGVYDSLYFVKDSAAAYYKPSKTKHHEAGRHAAYPAGNMIYISDSSTHKVYRIVSDSSRSFRKQIFYRDSAGSHLKKGELRSMTPGGWSVKTVPSGNIRLKRNNLAMAPAKIRVSSMTYKTKKVNPVLKTGLKPVSPINGKPVETPSKMKRPENKNQQYNDKLLQSLPEGTMQLFAKPVTDKC